MASKTILDKVNEWKKALQKNVKVKVLEEETRLIPTGIEMIDIMTNGGFLPGGFVEIVGMPGLGKTLLALQIIKNSLDQFPESIAVVIDAETALTPARLLSVGIDINRVIHIRGVTVEKVFEIIDEIMQLKDETGDKSPSFILWDSIAATPPAKLAAGATIEQVTGLKARLLSQLLPQICADLENYNVALIAINQLRDKVQMDMFSYQEPVIKGLENYDIPGGKGQVFQASHFLKLAHGGYFSTLPDFNPKKTDVLKLTQIPEGHFIGTVINATFIKSKTSPSHIPFKMVSDPRRGVSNFWTRFMYLKEAGKITSAGGWWKLAGLSKNPPQRGLLGFLKMLQTDKEAQELFNHYWEELKAEFSKAINQKTNVYGSGQTDEMDELQEQLEKQVYDVTSKAEQTDQTDKPTSQT